MAVQESQGNSTLASFVPPPTSIPSKISHSPTPAMPLNFPFSLPPPDIPSHTPSTPPSFPPCMLQTQSHNVQCQKMGYVHNNHPSPNFSPNMKSIYPIVCFGPNLTGTFCAWSCPGCTWDASVPSAHINLPGIDSEMTWHWAEKCYFTSTGYDLILNRTGSFWQMFCIGPVQDALEMCKLLCHRVAIP